MKKFRLKKYAGLPLDKTESEIENDNYVKGIVSEMKKMKLP